MTNLRRQLTMLAVAALTALSACGRPEHAGLPPDVRRELEHGREAVAEWVLQDRAAGVPADEVVIALGYLERLRLGLGSPFRLVESALADPRLPPETRHEVAWALLARTLSGDAYEVDAVALDRAGMAGVETWPGLGRHHLRLIESVVSEARDPRSGELAVRLAYDLAMLEGSLPNQAPVHATRVAALVRDREMARKDVARLLRSAEVAQGDPLRAIAEWRSQRWLNVEAPPLTDAPESVEREALELMPKLADALRMLTPRMGQITDTRPGAPDVNTPVLSASAARRLGEIADSINMPLVTPIVIASRTYRRELMQQPWLTDSERELRELFTTTGTEEHFVARLAQLSRTSPHDAVPSLAAVWAGVAMRTLAQEPVWFPGFGGPGNSQLVERFGLASVRFADGIPAEWRPYYRTRLEHALQDMQRVLPALDLRGLSVRFAAPQSEATLAMHDPRSRELILPPGSAAGTIAHEVAHDVDWQVALRQYRVRGDYASDRVARGATGNDRLAVRLRGLAPNGAVAEHSDERTHAHAQRPAENFARAMDWFVASMLAAEGRSNGFLTSVQDDALTGYGTVRAPDLTGQAGDALIKILDEIAPLYPEVRERFLTRYGSGRPLSAADLLRTMVELEVPQAQAAALEAPAAANPSMKAAFDAIASARDSGLRAIDSWVCSAPGGAREPYLEEARRQLVVRASAARARRVALAQARRLHGEEGARWVARQLYGGPWPRQEIEEPMEELLLELVEEARSVTVREMEPPTSGFTLLTQGGLALTDPCPASSLF